MQITDLLKSQSIQLNADPATKIDAIYILGDLMEKGGHLADKDTYLQAVFERENSGSTGLGEGIATPHAKSSGVKDAGLSAMVVPGGVDFDSLDGNPARLFFMIAAPEGAANTHVEVLSKLATMIIDPDFKEALIAADSTERFLALIDAKENDKFDVTVPGFIKTEDTLTDVANDMSANATTVAATAATATAETTGANEEKPSARKVKGQYDVLAVTACPTGIAHTYMAAESLERKAKEMGISLKVEKNGAAGIKDALTPEEISNAKCIIIAADKQVAMARFIASGCRVLFSCIPSLNRTVSFWW